MKRCLEASRAAALAPVLHVGAALRIEEDHRLRAHRAALGGAERQRVDAGLPGGLGGRDVHARERIAEPRAVHVHGDAMPVRDLGQFAHLGDAIDRAAFGRLRQRQHARADMMRPAPGAVLERAAQGRRRDLAPLAGQSDQLDAAAEELRRAAFVDRDMQLRMAQHRAPGRGQMGERERVRRRAGRHQEYRDLALEKLGEALLDPPGPVVIAIAGRIAGIGLPDRLQDGRRDAGRVVACEVHALPHVPSGPRRLGTMQFCCAALSIHVPLVTCREGTGQQTRGRRWIRRARALARVAGFGHIRTVLLSQLADPLRRPRQETASGPVRDR